MTHKKASAGFTLIEMMIVVAIVALLAAIALPSYREQVIRTRRSTAAACLTELTQLMERRYSTTMAYTGNTLPTSVCITDLANVYAFSFPADPTATDYSISATPQGAQLRDDLKCATLSMNQTGQKSVSGTETVGYCWK